MMVKESTAYFDQSGNLTVSIINNGAFRLQELAGNGLEILLLKLTRKHGDGALE